MFVLACAEELARETGSLHLAIGVFDGVHRGHQAVLQAAIDAARTAGGCPVMVTFDPHPASVLRPSQAPRLLTSLPHKLALASALGVQKALVLPFTPGFSQLTASRFIESLFAGGAPVRSMSVGHDWRFGRDRGGDLAALREIGAAHGFAVTGVPPLRVHGHPVSSTRIRSLIASGHLDEAALSLGRRYSVLGAVSRGSQLGRTLGFPTANVDCAELQLPPLGVYAGRATLGPSGHGAVVNLGRRPTVAASGAPVILEVHLLDYQGPDFYGEDLEIAFLSRLRGEEKFASLSALTDQIRSDISRARELLAR